MRNTFFLALLLGVLSFSGLAQQDARLMVRVDSMMKITQASDFEKLLDYTYPKLFTIATREQLAEAMKNALETEAFSTTLDSVKVSAIYPVFTLQDGQYAKIKHTMLMRMKFKQVMDDKQAATILSAMEEGFGKANLRFDKPNNTLIIFITSEMVAIKDDYAKEWSFVNYRDGDATVNLLFSKEVIEKLKEYK